MIALPTLVASAIVAIGGTTNADAGMITFDDLQHGEIVANQYLSSDGLVISAVNYARSFDLAIAFDTENPNTADPDLQGPPWLMGNLAPGTTLNEILVIAENDIDVDGNPGILDDPDDEGARPAGELVFDFDAPITSFGFDIVDIEWVGEEPGSVTFYNGAVPVGSVNFVDLITPASLFFDDSIEFGDMSANRIDPISAVTLAAVEFDRVVISLGGSGGIDNVTYTRVPSPGSLALLAVAALASRRGRRRM